ncbi:UNVERIFIED_CONTAM: hypothetical protein NCL1_25447 [Trichonephila clavipes]
MQKLFSGIVVTITSFIRASIIRTSFFVSTFVHLEGEKDYNDDHRDEITDFVQSIQGFQECDEDIETWMACDAEDCGFQILNVDEIVTSVQEESDPVDDETDEDEDNNIEKSYGVVRATIRVLSYSTTAAQENQTPFSEETKVYYGTAKNK